VNWARECVVSWIPIIGPAICKVFEWVCRAFEYVCLAAVWITQWVCHAWNVITTFICLTWLTFVAAASIVAGVFIKAVFSIPIVGALLRELLNAATSLAVGIVGFIVEGGACGLLGICPPKKLRVCVIIAHDANGPVATQATVQPIVDRLVAIFLAEANVNVYAHYESGGPTPNVDPKCDAEGWLQDLGLPGSQYENSASLNCRDYNFASIIGIGSAIYAFAVRDIEGKNGCSLGPLANYVLFEPTSSTGCRTHLAHEIGHACNLMHTSDQTNLMFAGCANPGRDQISGFQKVIIRGSKYCTYF
jgi:hypothetical protein